MGTESMTAAPIVGLPADTFEKSGFLFHSVGDKYLRAVAEIAKCQPLMIPSSEVINLDDVLDQLHGLVLTGAPSMSILLTMGMCRASIMSPMITPAT